MADWLVADSEDEEFSQLPPVNAEISVSTRAAAVGNLTSPEGKL